ncbi:MAG: hypothetical protein EBX82_03560, partial [Actinobacteria bacterium]|nr:hypothetical protein [Actinomycetota bacterium]
MRTFKFKRSLTLVAVSSLLSITVVSIPTAAQASPVCTTASGVTTHGYRNNVPLPATLSAATGFPTTVANTPEPAPGGNAQIIGTLLAKGYAVMGSGFARQGWNADSAIKTNVELIGVFKKQYPKTT